ncbi:ABC transporter permease [Lapillicoccus sp.]|uniref:ABC transporter permease n=1 Tax=Lapillicoccus sp. TaxID=1909287 RepID=UPI0026011DAD|nr:ABC transporter permease [Lapillicoccus sp.]
MSVVSRRRSDQSRLRTQLIKQLVRKDLKIKYQGSTLGFAWSLANPLLMLVVYTIVFTVVFKNTVSFFGFFLLSGLLIWNFFQMSVMGAATSITGNAGLVKKVPFPHIALPLSSIGFAGVQVALQYLVLIVAMSVAGLAPIRPELLLLVPALVVVVTLTLGLSLLVAATTVRYKDTQHILEILMFAWVWASGVIYTPSLVRDRLGSGLKLDVYYLNPMAGVTATFQRAFYGQLYGTDGKLILASDSVWFYLKVLGLGFVVSLVVLAIGAMQFRRQSADFAEDL